MQNDEQYFLKFIGSYLALGLTDSACEFLPYRLDKGRACGRRRKIISLYT